MFVGDSYTSPGETPKKGAGIKSGINKKNREGGKVDIDAAGNLNVASIDTEGKQGYSGGEIKLASGGTLTVGELNASGGAGENWGSGHDGAPIELTGAEVI